MLCDDLEGGMGGGRDAPEGRNICVPMVNSRCTTETNTTL